MPKISFLTEQVVDRLRQQIHEGRWRETLPGRYPLAEELGCSHWTIDKAVEQLVKEGLLISQGSGRPKQINMNILKWFHQQGIACFAYFGSRGDLPLPTICPDKNPAILELVGRLIRQGHHRRWGRRLALHQTRSAESRQSAEVWSMLVDPPKVSCEPVMARRVIRSSSISFEVR